MKLDQHFVRFLLIQLVLVSSLSYLTATGAKLIFHVPRPCEGQTGCEDTSSFPSRHATVAFGLATMIALAFRKLPYTAVSVVIAALVGYWRIAIGEHTLVDVFGGLMFGVAIGFAVYYFVKKFHGVRARRE